MIDLLPQGASLADTFFVWVLLVAASATLWAALLSPFIIAAWIRDNMKDM